MHVTLFSTLTLVSVALAAKSGFQRRNVCDKEQMFIGSMSKLDGCGWTHKVLAGETCEQILGNYNEPLSLKDFHKVNPAINADCSNLNMAVGQSVCVVGPAQKATGSWTLEQGCTKYRHIQAGDTCESIVTSIGDISLEQLFLWNPQIDMNCSNLHIGRQLCTCDGQ